MKYKIDALELTDEVRQTADGEFISLPSGNTHFKREGDGGEWVVLVHGYATPYYIYDKIAKGLLENGYRVLRYDLLGRGLSERVRGKYNPELFVSQLLELTKAVIGDSPFFLFGTSMGGIITTSFTAKHPEKVKKLVLLAPAGMVYDVPLYMKLAKIKGMGELLFKTFAGKTLIKNCAAEMIYSGEDVQNDYRERFAYCAQFKGFIYATLSSMRHTLLDFPLAGKGYDGTRESKVPVLTVWGTADKTMPYYQTERMRRALPDMELVSFEGSGHIFLYDEGEKTLETVLPFLKK
jgi:pimeloyl-ACP methyl ester carboxylesterase